MSYSQQVKNLPIGERNSGLKFNITNVIMLLVLMGPLFVMGMLLVLSIFNSTLKGVVYLIGVSILYALIALLQKSIGSLFKPPETQYNAGFCSIFSSNYIYTANPSFNSALYSFTLFYLLYPMIYHGMINIPLIVFFIVIYTLDTVVRIKIASCVSASNVIIGTLIGTVFSAVYYTILQGSSDTKKYLYYNDFDSNRVACSRPSKTNFKCRIVENGQLVS